MELVDSMVRVARRAREHVIQGRGMTNVSVYNFCKEVCTDSFLGVYSADSIPKRTLAGRASFLIIINLGNGKTREDGHFVAVAGFNDGILYLDPFGFEPPFGDDGGEVRPFLRLCRREVYYNSKQIQDFRSSYCALYAILFVWYLDSERPFRLTFRIRGNLLLNDRTCIDYLRRLMAKSVK
jgi:hypothetical protein